MNTSGEIRVPSPPMALLIMLLSSLWILFVCCIGLLLLSALAVLAWLILF